MNHLKTNHEAHHLCAPDECTNSQMIQKSTTMQAAAVLGLSLAITLALAPLGYAAATPPYSFKVITSLGSAAPAGGTFVNDFEPGGLNSAGDMAFGADASTGGEGVFLRHNGQIIELGRTGGAAPGD